MDKSPHWPGLGRYVGAVDDTYWFFSRIQGLKGNSSYIFFSESPHQKRRVYQDELDYLNKEIK